MVIMYIISDIKSIVFSLFFRLFCCILDTKSWYIRHYKKKDGENMLTVGERIKAYRKERGLTQKELAEKSNLSRSHIASIEGNQYTPSLATLGEISKALEIDSALLISDTLDTTPILNKKDQMEIDEYLNNFENELLTQTGLMFDGEPMTQESKEKLIAAMRIGAEMAKKEAKEKYTPKKFRNN